MSLRKRITAKGFEDKALRLARIDRELRMETLRNVGNVGVSRVIPSDKDKAKDPRRQRKQKDWQRGDD